MDNFEEQINLVHPKKTSAVGFIALMVEILILIFTSLIYNVFFTKISVKGSSMYPTLHDGQILTVSKFQEVKYGDIIVIKGELFENGEPQWIVKRVVGLPGDTIKIKGGYVEIKKKGELTFSRLEESYLSKESLGNTFNIDGKDERTYQVLENEIFYLGDNRERSEDSRSKFSNCYFNQVVGVVTNNDYNWLRPLDVLFLG